MVQYESRKENNGRRRERGKQEIKVLKSKTK